MKKKSNIFVRLFKKLGSIFEKLIINPLTKLLIKGQKKILHLLQILTNKYHLYYQ